MLENVKNVVENEEAKQELYCDCCGRLIDNDNYIEFDDKILCEDCECDETCICDDCGERIWCDDSIWLDGYDKVICQSCRNYDYVRCDECGEIVHCDDARRTAHDDYICEDCYDEYYNYCECCEEIYHNDELYYDDNGNCYYCEECYEHRKNKAIHDYYYKPEPIFYNCGVEDNFYMGVELEIDGGGEYDENAEILLNVANYDAEHIYIKHDGSIDRGFEIVSHPATLEYHTHNIQWQKLMVKALELKYRSHDTSTCGLHIHISRLAFGDTYEEQENNIAKIIYFVEQNWNNVLLFTRRTEENLNHWASRYGIEPTIEDTYEKAKGNYNRYKCINLQNSNTIEFRMFRGTLKYSTFIATLQFVEILCHFVINTGCYDWNTFVGSIPLEYKELIEYLKSKNLM